MTKKKIAIVKNESIGKIAYDMGIHKWLILSSQTEEKKIRTLLKKLGCLFEAFIGALYLDTRDIGFVKDFLIKVYEKYVDFSEIILNDTNYKDQLQRYLQNRFKEYPKYVVEECGSVYKCTIYKRDEIYIHIQ